MTAGEDLLARYLARALAEREADREPDLQAICAGHPELAGEVRAALQLHDALPDPGAPGLEDPGPPERLAGRYRLDEVLGQGTSGIVYRAEDRELGRPVAVKVLRPAVLVGELGRQRFAREAEVLARLEHPHVVRIYDRGSDGQRHYLVTELLQGRSLQQVLDAACEAMPEGPLAAVYRRRDWLAEAVGEKACRETSALRQIVRWMLELARGLHAAHAQGVLHRDVKPSNGWVRKDGRALVLDFGLALRAADPAATAPGSMLGTPWYMAPEQARSAADLGPPTDVYGLTATLYHLLTLQAPHPGDLHQVLAGLRERDPVPAARRHAGLPRDLQAILDRGLERDPHRRYPSMQALADDLQAFLEHRPVRARPIGVLGRALRRARRRPAAATAIAAGLSALLLLFVVVPLWQARQTVLRDAERRQLLAGLPSQLAIEGWPDQRLLQPLDERAGYLRDLDRLLELDPADAPVRLLRASVRLDAGDHVGSRADLAALASRSPYLAAVAGCYQQADDSSAGIEAVLLADLPEPASAEDRFVAGFHALRARDSKRALELLDAAAEADPEYLPARDLRLLALLDQGRGRLARDEANQLEGRYGGPTARTRHAIGVSLLLERRYREAIPVLEQALALRPGRHGPLINLATAHLRTGNPRQAEAFYRQAIAARPWFDNSRAGLAQTLNLLERFDEARREAERIGDAAWRAFELGNIDMHAAIVARQAGQPDHRGLASRAAQQFEACVGADPDHRVAGLARVSALLAQALARDELDAAIEPLLLLMRASPHDTHAIFNLVVLLRDRQLDPWLVALLRLYLVEFAIGLSPDEPRLQSLRREVLADLRRLQDRSK